MDNNINYSLLINAIWKHDNDIINYIYDAAIRDQILDRKLIVRLMGYMYSIMNEDKYMNVLKLFNRIAENDSEIAYFISFYFLMKNSPYHTFVSLKMVENDESPYYYALAQHNISFLEKTNSKITYVMKRSLEKALIKEPNNILIKEQLDNLNNIEKDIQNTVIKMIDMTKKDNIPGKNNFNFL